MYYLSTRDESLTRGGREGEGWSKYHDAATGKGCGIRMMRFKEDALCIKVAFRCGGVMGL